MKPGATSLPGASITRSAVPSKRAPTWTMRPSSHTTTPSRISVCVRPPNPTTQPPRINPRMAPGLAELRVAGGLGRALAFQEDLESLGLYPDEACEQELVERRRHGGRLVYRQERRGEHAAPRGLAGQPEARARGRPPGPR